MPSQPYRPLSSSERDEKQDAFLPERPSSSRRPYQRLFSTFLPWLLTLIFGVSTCLLFFNHARVQIAGDINGISPTFHQSIVNFQPNSSFVANLTNSGFKASTHQLWLNLVPKGLGFLHIKDHERYPNLPPPYHRHNKTVYTASMTHQLHCLYMIMGSYNDIAVNGYEDPAPDAEDPHWHIAHCFDYIRQAIMCAGDVTLEGHETTFPTGHKGTDGWNVKHVCKNYDEVYDWLEEMRVDNRTRI